ncbi:MAG: WG repeat-containing protein [Verrucomicrobiia bacterium]
MEASSRIKLIGPGPAHGFCGYIDESGNPRIPFQYQGLGEFREGLAWFQQHDKIGYIDEHNRVVIPPVFDRRGELHLAGDFCCGLAPVRVGMYEGFIDSSGALHIDPQFDYCSSFVGGIALVADKEKGFCTVDLNGTVLSRLDFCSVANTPYEADFIKVFKLMPDGETAPGFVDRFGRIVSGPFEELEDILEYSAEHPFLAPAVFRGGRGLGFIGKQGRVYVTPSFTAASGYSEGLAAAATKGYLWGYIDAAGQWVIEPRYTWAHPFKAGTATVSTGRRSQKRWYVIDRENRVLSEETFDQVVSESDDGFRIMIKGSSVVVLDRRCRIIYRGPRG